MLKGLAERMKKMKTKPDYIKLPLTLAFDDWKRLRTSSPATLRPEDKDAIVNGVLAAVHKEEPVVYLCAYCNTYTCAADIHKNYYCPKCNEPLTSRDKVLNIHNL
jgi:rubrerythrin